MWEENFGIRYLDKQLVHILSVPQVFLFLMQTQIIQIKSSETSLLSNSTYPFIY